MNGSPAESITKTFNGTTDIMINSPLFPYLSILDNEDLNRYTYTGFYSVVNTCNNKPSSVGGVMLVLDWSNEDRSPGNSYQSQLFFANSSAGKSNLLFLRTSGTAGWNDWVTII